MTVGRPTEYTPEIVDQAHEYADGGWRVHGDKIPSLSGLACVLGLSRETLRLWGKDENKQFFGILEKIDAMQERELINNGLSGDFSGTISKLMLHRHGYTDKVDNTSSDGSMTPKPTTIELIGKPVPDDDSAD